MPRTTVDIEEPILSRLKAIGQREGRPLGKVISELVAEALANRRGSGASTPQLSWISRPMGAAIDWADSEALAAVQEQDDRTRLAGSPAGR